MKRLFVVVVQLLSHVWLFATSWTEACQSSLSSTISQSMLKFMSIESVMLSNHLILCRSILLLPSIFSSIRVFSNQLALHIRWPKFWSFSFSISPSGENSVISFRTDWFDLLALLKLLTLIKIYYKSMPWFMSTSVLPMFSSRSFMVYSPTFRSSTHFEFIFVYGVRECCNFILSYVAVQFSQHHLLKRLSFLHCLLLLLLW